MTGHEFEVRLARTEDRDALVALLEEADEHDGGARGDELASAPLGAALRLSNPQVVVAEATGELVGLALFHRVQPALLQPGALFMEDLYVTEDWRRRGVARALVSELLRIAEREGRVRVDFTARPTNEAGLAFYAAMGAQRFDETVYLRFEVAPEE